MPRNSFIITFRLEAPDDQTLVSVEEWADTMVDNNSPSFRELNKNLFVESVIPYVYLEPYTMNECTIYCQGLEVANFFVNEKLAQKACDLLNKDEKEKWESEGYIK